MTPIPYGITTYCDDIRHEVGNKISLMGCFSGELRVFGDLPIALSTLAAFVNLRIPAGYDFEKVSLVMSIEDEESTRELARAELSAKDASLPEIQEGRLFSVDIPIKFANFLIERNGFLRSRAFVDDLEVKMGSLKIQVLPAAELPQELAMLNPVKS